MRRYFVALHNSNNDMANLLKDEEAKLMGLYHEKRPIAQTDLASIFFRWGFFLYSDVFLMGHPFVCRVFYNRNSI